MVLKIIEKNENVSLDDLILIEKKYNISFHDDYKKFML